MLKLDFYSVLYEVSAGTGCYMLNFISQKKYFRIQEQSAEAALQEFFWIFYLMPNDFSFYILWGLTQKNLSKSNTFNKV